MRAVRVVQGDLASLDVDVVVRASRTDGTSITPLGRRIELTAGDGVAGHLAQLGDLPLGSAVLTPAGALAAPYLLHLVLASGEEPVTETTIRRALAAALSRAEDWALSTLAMPPLGGGVGDLETEGAARLVAQVLDEHGVGERDPREVTVVVESDYELDVYRRALGAEPGPEG